MAAPARTATAAPPEPAPPGTLRFVVILGALIGISPLTIDTYLPALPAITADLHTQAAAVQLTLTGTFVGIAVGQVLVGPWSDAVGRRLPLVGGLALHVLASLLCMVAPTVGVLGVMRVLQGLGVAAAGVVANAVVRDRFTGLLAAKVFSRLMLVMGAAPILAPALGSLVLRWTGWRGVFALLAVLGLVLVTIAVLTLPESLPPRLRRRDGFAGHARAYRTVLRDRPFLGLALVAAFGLSALFAYVAGSPFVYQNQFGLTAQQFGFVFGAGAVGLIIAAQVNVWLLGRYPPQRIVAGALMAGVVAGAALVLCAATGAGGMFGVIGAMWGVLASAGLVLPNTSALALTRHGEAAGTAAALLGAAQFGTGALVAPLVGVLGADGVAMAVVVAGCLLVALLAMVLVVRPARLADPFKSTVDPVAGLSTVEA